MTDTSTPQKIRLLTTQSWRNGMKQRDTSAVEEAAQNTKIVLEVEPEEPICVYSLMQHRDNKTSSPIWRQVAPCWLPLRSPGCLDRICSPKALQSRRLHGYASKSSRALDSKVLSKMPNCTLKSANVVHLQKICLCAEIIVSVSAPHGQQACSSSVGASLASLPVHKPPVVLSRMIFCRAPRDSQKCICHRTEGFRGCL